MYRSLPFESVSETGGLILLGPFGLAFVGTFSMHYFLIEYPALRVWFIYLLFYQFCNDTPIERLLEREYLILRRCKIRFERKT